MRKSFWQGSVFLILLSGLLAGTSLPQESALTRTFLVDFGQGGIAVDVNGREGRTDGQGILRVTIRVTAGETLRFRSLDEAWALDAVRTVPAEDPGVPVLWDLTAELRPVDPLPEDAAPRPSAVPDPCRSRKSLRCRQAKWRRFESAMARRDCGTAIRALAELESQYPELLTAGGSLLAFTKAYLDCGTLTGDQDLVRRSVELASRYDDGAFWCGAAESRLLARGFEVLGELAAAAESAAAARRHCGRSADAGVVPLEWELYFRFRLGDHERFAALAAEAPPRLRLFLQAWLEWSRGECVTEVELEPSGDLPCHGLPQEFCSRQYGRILLACGDEDDDFTAAARFLRAALPGDPATWKELADADRLILELAEAEVLSGDHAAATELYERLLDGAGSASGDAAGRAELWRLYGDVLLLSSTSEKTLRGARSAYVRARQDLRPGSLAFAVVMNNLCVLHGRLEETMSTPEIARDLESLDTAVDQVPETEGRLRLWLLHSALSIRIQLLEKETDLDVQEKLVRLRELRIPFTEYQRELEALAVEEKPFTARGAGATLRMFEHGGRRFAVAVP